MTKTNSSTYETDDYVELDLRQILTIIRKWRKMIILMTMFCGITAGILSFFVLPSVYQAKTLLLVNQATDKLQTQPSYLGKEDNLSSVVGSVSRMPVLTMSTYLGQLKSETLMNRIIEKLCLEDYTPEALAGMIDAQLVKDSNLIEVKVTGPDRLLNVHIANTLSDEYLKLMTEKNQQQMSRSVDFLERQKQITDKKLAAAEVKLEGFQSQANGIAVLEAKFNKMSEDVVNDSSRLSNAQVEIQQLNAGIASLTDELQDTPKIIIVDHYNDAKGETYQTQEANPLYNNLYQQLSAKKASLAEKQGEAAALSKQIALKNTQLDTQQAELAGKKLELDKLQREVDRLKKTSETLAEKKTETQIAKSIDLGDTSVNVVSEASIPTNPIKPNKKLNIAIAMILGVTIFTLLALILETLDSTLKTPDDVRCELELPVLGIVPLFSKENSYSGSAGG